MVRKPWMGRRRSGLFLWRVRGGGEKGSATSRKMVDYQEVLTEPDFRFFLQLREWRKVRAEEEGCDAFNIFTNAQLASIAEKRPASLDPLKAIPGVGQGRRDKYGAAVLALVRDRGTSSGVANPATQG